MKKTPNFLLTPEQRRAIENYLLLEGMEDRETLPIRDEPFDRVAEMRMWSVVVISTQGSLTCVDTDVVVALDAESAKIPLVNVVAKTKRLIRHVDAFHIPRSELEAALRVVVA